MDITKIWLSQRNLRRAGQIPSMIETLCEGGVLPPITLARCEDGEVQLEDGHHRLAAIWLSGKTDLDSHDYVMLEKDQWKPRFGRITDLIQKLERLKTS
jgi:hypothetical protein